VVVDVQEGVDLHTFCKRVLHYGITGSSAGTEQRTGRVDRLGSLVHRKLDPDDELTKLQVHFPHLQETIEPLQAAVLYRRMNRFMRMVHDGLGAIDRESTEIGVDAGLKAGRSYPPPYREPLVTSFAVQASDRGGGDLALAPSGLDHWPGAVRAAVRSIDRSNRPIGDRGTAWCGELWLENGQCLDEAKRGLRRQPYAISLRSRRDGSGVALRLESPVGALPGPPTRVDWPGWRLARETPGLTLHHQGWKRGQVLLSARMDLPLWDADGMPRRIRQWLFTLLLATDRLEVLLIHPDADLPLREWR
jgi:hypothetical protein